MGEKHSKAGGIGYIRLLTPSVKTTPEGFTVGGQLWIREATGDWISSGKVDVQPLHVDFVPEGTRITDTEIHIRQAADKLGIKLNVYTPEELIKQVVNAPFVGLQPSAGSSVPSPVRSYNLGEVVK